MVLSTSYNNQGFPGGSDDKNLPAMQEDRVPSLSWEDLLEKGMATYSSMRNLVGYSTWGHKESDTTEQLTHTQC